MSSKGINEQPAWMRNEFQQINVDFADTAVVEKYEQFMGEFRDLPAEDAAILSALALPAGSHVLEIGTGTGHFALAAARAGHRVSAVDISPAMLEFASARAKNEGLTDVEFSQAGFLTLSAPAASFDAVVSVAVLHHLPDLWKAVALRNIHRVLKPGGRFVLRDVVFSSDGGDPRPKFDSFLAAVPPAMHDRAASHVAKEFSTIDWIMEGLLARAGFEIEQVNNSQAPLIQYVCRAKQP